MKKINKVEFTKRAANDLDKLVDNIKTRQSDKVAKDFTEDFDRVIDLIQDQPDMFEASPKIKGTRRGLFHKYGAFLYRVFKKSIRVVTFFDTRTKQ
ncbi:MAG: type II toxin-antitoxin system RelE/ParE family toxin [Aureispira sp.]|nr:type II toxin-antitoxin system RelE/ParE family toxin [Aureispira sp.]